MTNHQCSPNISFTVCQDDVDNENHRNCYAQHLSKALLILKEPE